MLKKTIPIEISARHIHLSQKDLDKLFGKNYSLKKMRDLSQSGEFATVEQVECKKIKFRIVGPLRNESQIEISRTESIKLKINPPLKLSGDLKDVETFLTVQGPKGKAKIKIIVAKRHLHCSFEEAKKMGLKQNQKIKVAVAGERGLIFDNVIVRAGKSYHTACHIDTDEANACGLDKICGVGKIV